jgi:hypothetical protein
MAHRADRALSIVPRPDLTRPAGCEMCRGWGTVVTDDWRHELCPDLPDRCAPSRVRHEFARPTPPGAVKASALVKPYTGAPRGAGEPVGNRSPSPGCRHPSHYAAEVRSRSPRVLHERGTPRRRGKPASLRRGRCPRRVTTTFGREKAGPFPGPRTPHSIRAAPGRPIRPSPQSASSTWTSCGAAVYSAPTRRHPGPRGGPSAVAPATMSPLILVAAFMPATTRGLAHASEAWHRSARSHLARDRAPATETRMRVPHSHPKLRWWGRGAVSTVSGMDGG